MSSADQRISDELKQSSCFKRELSLKIIELPLSSLGICADGTVSDFLKDSVYSVINSKVEKFLSKYEGMIRNVCNSRRYYLGDESRDCEQFIRMSLCKLYKKRYAYTNFDKVVKSAIKRKAIDFSKSRNSCMKMTISETDLMSKVDEERTGEDIGLYRDDEVCEEAVYFDFLTAIFKIRDLVRADTRKLFTTWDLRLLDIICKNVEQGNLVITDMFDNEDFNKTELCFRFKILSNKIRENFSRSMFL